MLLRMQIAMIFVLIVVGKMVSDENQPDIDVGGPNDLCITDFRKRYEGFLKENPKYKWELHKFTNGLEKK